MDSTAVDKSKTGAKRLDTQTAQKGASR